MALFKERVLQGLMLLILLLKMKKIRLEKANPHHNPLSYKRGSLQQEVQQHKVQLRTESPHQTENSSSGKSFFCTMKNQLSTIKQDFEKLIKRQVSLKSGQPLTAANTNKSKEYVSAKKEPRSVSEYEKNKTTGGYRGQDQHISRVLNLEKNLPCSSGRQVFQHSYSKNNLSKEQKQVTSVFDGIELGGHTQPQCPQKDQRDENQLKMLNEKVHQLQQQLYQQKQQNQKCNQEINLISQQKISLTVHLSDLSQEITQKDQQLRLIDGKNKELRSIVEKFQGEIQMKGQKEWLNEKNQLTNSIQELSFHNDELRTVHHQVISQNQQLKQSVNDMQKYCDDVHRRCQMMETDFNKKMSFLEQDLHQYKKREDMFTQEIQRLQSQINPQSPPLRQISQSEEIQSLRSEIDHLRRQVQLQKELHQTLSKKFEEKINNGNGMTEMMVKLQKSLQQLVDQNGKLKTKINFAEANFESMNEQNKSYLEQIRLYQERDKNQVNKKQLRTNQWQEMMDKIEQLQEVNKKLKDDLEFKSFQKQTQQEGFHNPINEKLIYMNHKQITEIETLRQNIKELSHQNSRLSKQISEEMIISRRTKMGQSKQLEHLQVQLNKKMTTNKSLKELIFRVLVEKVGKWQDQSDADHILRQFKSLQEVS